MRTRDADKGRKTAALCCACLVIPLLVVLSSPVPPVRAQLAWTVEVLDSGNYTGDHNSLALDSLDHPHISYVSQTFSRELKYAHWDGSSWQMETVDVNLLGGCSSEGTSLALDSHDKPWIAYALSYDANCTDWDVMLAQWNGTAWSKQRVDPPGVNAGYSPSIAIDSKDRPHIVYHSETHTAPDHNLTLVYAVLNDSSWSYQTIFVTGFKGEAGPGAISLKLDSLDRPHVAYGDADGLKYIYWDGTQWLVDALGFADNRPVSLALDTKDRPHISYSNPGNVDVMYGHWNGSSWRSETAISGNVGEASSIDVDSNDVPHISYAHSGMGGPPAYALYYTNKKLGFWLDPPEVPDPQERVGKNSLVLDSHDLPHISYQRRIPFTSNEYELRYVYIQWIDAEPPVSHILPISQYWNGSPIQAAAADASGVANVTLWFRHSRNNSTWGSWTQFSTLTSPPWTWSFTFPTGEGYYEYYSMAVDILGNVEPPPAAADAIEGYDITPPFSIAMQISSYWHTTPSLAVNATATDNLSGVANVTLLYSHAPLSNASWSPWIPFGTRTSPPWSWSFPFPDGEGNYRFHTIAGDVAGNIEGSKNYAEAVAGYRIPPDYVPVNPLPSSSVTFGLSLPIQLSIEVLNSGGFENVNATLAFHNESSPSSPFFKAEVPPIPAGSTSGPFIVTWTSPATPCACHIVANVDYYDSVTESNETNNTYTWTVDVVPGPITSLSVGEPNYTTAETYVTSLTPILMTAIDQSGMGILRTMYSIDGGPWRDYSLTGQFTLTGEGEHSVRYYSQDNAGNVEATTTAAITVDNTPPVTVNSTGTPKYQSGYLYVTSSTAISLTSTDSGLTPVGLDEIEFRIDGGQWLSYSSNFNLAGSDGIHTIEYRSRDLLDNGEAVKLLTVFLDDTPPATTISPATGEFTTDTTFTLAAADQGCGPNVTRYRIDGGNWTDYIGGFTLPEGVHNISYYSNDMLNNTEQEKWLVLTVRGQPPPPEVTVNYKPIVALMFAIILAVVGAYSSNKRPLAIVKTRKRKFIPSWSILAIPFITVEAATGILSLSFEPLRVPPLVGWGTGVDCSVLFAGLLLMLLRLISRMKEREAVAQSRTCERIQ
jgi:hypothetical protein